VFSLRLLDYAPKKRHERKEEATALPVETPAPHMQDAAAVISSRVLNQETEKQPSGVRLANLASSTWTELLD